MIATGSDARPTRSLRSGLSDLLLQSFAGVTYTLVLIRIRRSQRSHFSRHLTHLLPVNSGERDPRLLGVDRSVAARGQRILDGMRVTETEHYHPFTLHLRPIADADDLQFAGPAPGHAFHRVVHQSSRQTVHRGLRIILANREQMSIFLFDNDASGQSRIQLAFRPLNQHSIAFDLDRYPFGERDRLFSNS